MIGSWIHRFSDKPGLLSLRALWSTWSRTAAASFQSRESYAELQEPCTFCFSSKVLFGSLSASNICFFLPRNCHWIELMHSTEFWQINWNTVPANLSMKRLRGLKALVAAWSAMRIVDTALLAAWANAWLDIRSRMVQAKEMSPGIWHEGWQCPTPFL